MEHTKLEVGFIYIWYNFNTNFLLWMYVLAEESDCYQHLVTVQNKALLTMLGNILDIANEISRIRIIWLFRIELNENWK